MGLRASMLKHFNRSNRRESLDSSYWNDPAQYRLGEHLLFSRKGRLVAPKRMDQGEEEFSTEEETGG